MRIIKFTAGNILISISCIIMIFLMYMIVVDTLATPRSGQVIPGFTQIELCTHALSSGVRYSWDDPGMQNTSNSFLVKVTDIPPEPGEHYLYAQSIIKWLPWVPVKKFRFEVSDEQTQRQAIIDNIQKTYGDWVKITDKPDPDAKYYIQIR